MARVLVYKVCVLLISTADIEIGAIHVRTCSSEYVIRPTPYVPPEPTYRNGAWEDLLRTYAGIEVQESQAIQHLQYVLHFYSKTVQSWQQMSYRASFEPILHGQKVAHCL
jgi:hypothetical protein